MNLLLHKLRHAYRRSALHANLNDKTRLLSAVGIGVMVGVGMAVFMPFVHQPPLLIGLGSGVAAFLMMLFLER